MYRGEEATAPAPLAGRTRRMGLARWSPPRMARISGHWYASAVVEFWYGLDAMADAPSHSRPFGSTTEALGGGTFQQTG